MLKALRLAAPVERGTEGMLLLAGVEALGVAGAWLEEVSMVVGLTGTDEDEAAVVLLVLTETGMVVGA